MKSNISKLVDTEIEILEAKMKVAGKNVISTESLRKAVLLHISIDGNNDDTDRLAIIGFGQVIQSRLWCKGYRSVRPGFFTNPDTCSDANYIVALVQNKELDIDEDISVERVLKDVRDTRFDGQLSFDENGKIIIPMTEEEFMEKIRADAV